MTECAQEGVASKNCVVGTEKLQPPSLEIHHPNTFALCFVHLPTAISSTKEKRGLH